MPTATLHALTGATFDEDLAAADRPVLVDFTAEWCPPCHALKPVLAEVAAEHADRLLVRTVDVDRHPEVARRFDVVSMPTLLLFRHGRVEARLVGGRGKARLLQDLAGAVDFA